MTLELALRSAGARQRSTDPGTLCLDERSAPLPEGTLAWEERQEQALEALLHTVGGPWFLAMEDPTDLPAMAPAAPNTVLLPSDLCAGGILNSPGLRGGNWVLYSAAHPVALSTIPAVYSGGAAFHRWRETQTVTAVLYATGGGSEWHLYLDPSYLARAVVVH